MSLTDNILKTDVFDPERMWYGVEYTRYARAFMRAWDNDIVEVKFEQWPSLLIVVINRLIARDLHLPIRVWTSNKDMVLEYHGNISVTARVNGPPLEEWMVIYPAVVDMPIYQHPST